MGTPRSAGRPGTALLPRHEPAASGRNGARCVTGKHRSGHAATGRRGARSRAAGTHPGCVTTGTASTTTQRDAQGQKAYATLYVTRFTTARSAGKAERLLHPRVENKHFAFLDRSARSAPGWVRGSGQSVFEESHVVGESGELLFVGDGRDRGWLCTAGRQRSQWPAAQLGALAPSDGFLQGPHPGLPCLGPF